MTAPPPVQPLDLETLETQTVGTWDPGVRAFVQEGAGAGRAMVANRRAHGRWGLRSRVLVDVSRIDTSVCVLGRSLALPVLAAPSGLHTLVHRDGEVGTARGVRAAGSLMVLSSGTGRTMEDVCAVGAPTWFQLYWNDDRERVRRLIEQAVAAGCSAVCLTVDMPVRPLIGPSMQQGVRQTSAAAQPLYLLPREAHLAGGAWDHDARLSWRDLDWLRGVCPVPIVLKGVMTPEDARLAHESGVDAVAVSNHGGRALDTPIGTMDVLPEILHEVRGTSLEVYVDGGFRHGSEVLVAVALGATAVMLGRPVLWGLGSGGADGVRDVFLAVGEQLRRCMAMVGARSLDELDTTRIRRPVD